jgi:hypothetical protein
MLRGVHLFVVFVALKFGGFEKTHYLCSVKLKTKDYEDANRMLFSVLGPGC